MEDSIFTKIIKCEIPAEIIYEDEFVIVIPDKFPSMEGQVLVVTKRQASYIFDLSETEYAALMNVTKKVALALDKTFETIRTCVIIEGFEVPHVHVRLYPCTEEKLIWGPRAEASNEELKVIAEKIKTNLD